jgi:S1-C subfamily serine protease
MKKLQTYVNLALIVTLLVIGLDTPHKDRFVQVVNKVMPSVVDIVVIGSFEALIIDVDAGTITPKTINAKIEGSGVFIADKGYIVTVAHLFNEFDQITGIFVTSPNGDVVKADIVKVSETRDLAIIQASYYDKNPHVKLANPAKLAVGQEVLAIGSPLGLLFSVSHGIISALYRDMGDVNYNVTQSDTFINPGNSGGPLFNLKGELIGVNSFMMPPVRAAVFTGLGFSVQCGEILRFLTDVKKTEKGLVL